MDSILQNNKINKEETKRELSTKFFPSMEISILNLKNGTLLYMLYFETSCLHIPSFLFVENILLIFPKSQNLTTSNRTFVSP